MPTILYIGFDPNFALLRRRRLAGIRRFAKAQGWDVATLSPEEASPGRVRRELKRLCPIGCIAECWMARHDLPPSVFGAVPVVYFNPMERPKWRGAASVGCDEAAVARAAFDELSAGLPPAYAAVDDGPPGGGLWARERIAAFRALCRKAGRDCAVFPECDGEEAGERSARLAAWAATLPPRCAVFAVNDLAAAEVAKAFAVVGIPVPRSATLIGVDAAEIPADGLPASTISSVKLDFELSGYLAAKALLARDSCLTRRRRDAEREQTDLLTPNGVHDAGNVSRVSGEPIRVMNQEYSALSAPPLGKTIPVFGPLLVERRKSTRGRGRREPWVLESVDMIRREACDGLSAEALARRFPVSRNLFERRFREAMGHSVLDEIIHVRMQRVFDLLARPDFPIGAIADFSGFGCGYGLRKLFRSRTGMSLREWRKTRN